MTKAPIWPVATDALIADTTHLTDAEFGAYMRLMIAQWRSNGQPLDFNPAKLARICGTNSRYWAERWEAIADFFDNTQLPSRVSQKRVVDDYEDVSHKITQAREAGARGGAAKARKTKGRHLADATNPLVADGKRKDSDPTESAISGTVAGWVADGYQSINHEPEEEREEKNIPTTSALCREAEPAEPTEPGGGFLEGEGFAEPDPTVPGPDEDLTIGDLPEHKPVERWTLLGPELLEITGLDQKAKPVAYGVVRQWLADWTEADILAAVQDVVDGENYDPANIGNLKYFEPAIRRRVEQRAAELDSEINDRMALISDTVWAKIIARWRAGEVEWDAGYFGPAPDQRGFKGPTSLAGPRDIAPGPAPRRPSNVTSFPEAAARQA